MGLALEYLPPSFDSPKGLKDYLASDSEIAKYTKEVDNMVRTLKHNILQVGNTVDVTDSSKVWYIAKID